MDAANTDKLIVRAIAALPYRRPSAGFAAWVMAQVAVPHSAPWTEYLLKAAGLAVAAWSAALTLVGAKLAYSNLPEIAAFFIQPGSVAQAVKLLTARAALLALKLAAAASFASDLAAAAAGWPAYYEVAAALVVCTAAMVALFKRPAYGRI